MKWKTRDETPPEGERILVYSPDCDDGEDALRYQIVSSEFFAIYTQVTHWALLEEPFGD